MLVDQEEALFDTEINEQFLSDEKDTLKTRHSRHKNLFIFKNTV